MDYVGLSKTISYALRHAPWEFELELDDEGWTSLDELLEELRRKRRFREATVEDLHQIIKTSSKSRFEIKDGQIRALYGHSVPGKLKKTPGVPPEILYHGTITSALSAIRRDGLKSMRRQYVHLSNEVAMAQVVGGRRGDDVVILKIPALEAHKAGLVFYEGNAQVWLADQVPPEWIIFPEEK